VLKPAIPNVFVRDFAAALACYTGPLGFRPLFIYGDTPFYAHVARDEAILALRHVTIHPVNPRVAEVQGLRTYPVIGQVPGPVDLAVLAIPAVGVAAALAECAAAGVRAAIVFSSGFAKIEEGGAAAQAALATAAQRAGIRLLGPNCLGLMNVGLRAICTFGQGPNQGLPDPAGPAAA